MQESSSSPPEPPVKRRRDAKRRAVAWPGEGKRSDSMTLAIWPSTWATLANYAEDLNVSKIRLLDMAVTAFCRALDQAPKTRAAITANERASAHDRPPRASGHDKRRMVHQRFGSTSAAALPQGSTSTRSGHGVVEKPS